MDLHILSWWEVWQDLYKQEGIVAIDALMLWADSDLTYREAMNTARHDLRAESEGKARKYSASVTYSDVPEDTIDYSEDIANYDVMSDSHCDLLAKIAFDEWRLTAMKLPERAQQIVELFLAGHNQKQIAEIVGISTCMVSIELNTVSLILKGE